MAEARFLVHGDQKTEQGSSTRKERGQRLYKVLKVTSPEVLRNTYVWDSLIAGLFKISTKLTQEGPGS